MINCLILVYLTPYIPNTNITNGTWLYFFLLGLSILTSHFKILAYHLYLKKNPHIWTLYFFTFTHTHAHIYRVCYKIVYGLRKKFKVLNADFIDRHPSKREECSLLDLNMPYIIMYKSILYIGYFIKLTAISNFMKLYIYLLI